MTVISFASHSLVDLTRVFFFFFFFFGIYTPLYSDRFNIVDATTIFILTQDLESYGQKDLEYLAIVGYSYSCHQLIEPEIESRTYHS